MTRADSEQEDPRTNNDIKSGNPDPVDPEARGGDHATSDDHPGAPTRPVDPETVTALGVLSDALETVERARGHLYAFHQLTGSADFKLGDAVEQLRAAGHGDVADRLNLELVGRNVLPGRWTFQIVEEYDDGYWSVFRELEGQVRQELAGGARHLYEANLKEKR